MKKKSYLNSDHEMVKRIKDEVRCVKKRGRRVRKRNFLRALKAIG